MHSSPAFSIAEFDRVARELLSGVAYLHEQGVAHRDLRPLNVLFSTAGPSPDQPHGTVKIAGFGKLTTDPTVAGDSGALRVFVTLRDERPRPRLQKRRLCSRGEHSFDHALYSV